MRVGIVSGSGAYTWPGLTDAQPHTVTTHYGQAAVTSGRVAGVEVVHLSRHGDGHARLSNQVQHRANLAALLESGVECVISLTVCGAVDPGAELGSLVVFDDLHFPDNRLPDGSCCTWYDTPGDPRRGHWIFDRPFSEPLREAALAAAAELDLPMVDGGCYGQVWGPRFNSRSEIAALAAAGVTAVSQTAGPEVVLAGEAELPLLLLGYLTDHANGVTEQLQPVEELLGHMAASVDRFAAVVEGVLGRVSAPPPPVGTVYRFDQGG